MYLLFLFKQVLNMQSDNLLSLDCNHKTKKDEVGFWIGF
jgi:hypothetical protein